MLIRTPRSGARLLPPERPWTLAIAKILPGDPETEHFRVRAGDENGSRENRTLNHGARDGLQRIAHFGA